MPGFLVKGGITYRILSDQVGSVRLVVHADPGAVAQRIDYDAFGVVTQDTNPGFQPFGFVGAAAAYGGSATLFSGGLAIGRGWEGGFYFGDPCDLLNSSAINLDTPFGGLSILLGQGGEWLGLGFGGPSIGLAATASGPLFSTPAFGGSWTGDIPLDARPGVPEVSDPLPFGL